MPDARPYTLNNTPQGPYLNGVLLDEAEIDTVEHPDGTEMIVIAIPAALVKQTSRWTRRNTLAGDAVAPPLAVPSISTPIEPSRIPAQQEPEQEPDNPNLRKHIKALGLTPDQTSFLKTAGVRSIVGVVRYTPDELKEKLGLAPATVQQIRRTLAGWGLTLKGDTMPRLDEDEPVSEEKPDLSKVPTSALNLTDKVLKSLAKGGVKNLKQLCELTRKELEGIDGISPEVCYEIRYQVGLLGFLLKDEREIPPVPQAERHLHKARTTAFPPREELKLSDICLVPLAVRSLRDYGIDEPEQLCENTAADLVDIDGITENVIASMRIRLAHYDMYFDGEDKE